MISQNLTKIDDFSKFCIIDDFSNFDNNKKCAFLKEMSPLFAYWSWPYSSHDRFQS